MTRSEFQSSEINMANLDELLKQPIFQVALEVAQSEALQDLPPPIPGVGYTEMVAAHGARAAGWVRGLKALTSLSRKTIPQKQPDQTEMHREAAVERLVKSGLYTESELNEIL